MTLPQLAAIAFAAGFFGTILFFTIRTWRRIGYCPITTFTSGNPKEILRTLIIWAVPPLVALGAWRTREPAFVPIEALARIEVQAVGVALLALGLTLFPLACAQLGDSWRIGFDPKGSQELVTRGLYARIRHPIYTSFVLMYAGTFLCGPSRFCGAVSAIAVLGFYLRSIVEEQELSRRFGDAYRDYMKRTGRLLPRW